MAVEKIVYRMIISKGENFITQRTYMGQEYNNLNKNSKCQQIQNDNGCVALKRRYKDKDKNKRLKTTT